MTFFFLIYLLQNIKCSFFNAKRPDDKAKSNSCAMVHYENNIEQFLILNKFGKGKKCVPDLSNNNNYMCVPELELRKTGQSCNYHEDCISGSCISG